ADRVPVALRLVDQRAQLDRTIGKLEVLQRTPDVLELEPERQPQSLVQRSDQAPGVDDQLGDAGLLEGRLLENVLVRVTKLLEAARERRCNPASISGDALDEDAVLEVDRLEQARAALERLRLADHQEAARVERKREVLQDALLGRRLEVHERVARDQEV